MAAFDPLQTLAPSIKRAAMSIEQSNVVDLVTIERGTGNVLLTISDHLPWETDEGNHLLLLQEKVNAYLRFIESGELVRKYPEAEGSPVINVVGKFPLSAQAQLFLQQATKIIEGARHELRFTLMQPH
jgi:hypothetical protein